MNKKLPIVPYSDAPFVLKEDLPLPYVHYPRLTGPFIGFSKEKDSEIYFCSCFKKTFNNYFLLYKKNGIEYENKTKNYILSVDDFPYDFVKKLFDMRVPSKREAVEKHILFRDNICHQCNHTSPQCRVHFCNMSTFELQHAWYIHKYKIDLGLVSSENYLETFPQEYLCVLKEIWNLNKKGWEAAKTHDYNTSDIFYKEAEKKYRAFHRIIENEVRSAFNYTLIGDRWKQETELYNMVILLFPKYEILRHYRPNWLEQLEIDIFIPQIPLAIEYQGIQHYQPLIHWGGMKSFKIRTEHDKRKFELLSQKNIPIVYFNYKDVLTCELVQSRLQPYI